MGYVTSFSQFAISGEGVSTYAW